MEIELKYSVPSDKAEKILQDMSADFGSEIRSIPMEAIYYDTEDKALRERRLTYRIRREGNENVLTIKYGRSCFRLSPWFR